MDTENTNCDEPKEGGCAYSWGKHLAKDAISKMKNATKKAKSEERFDMAAEMEAFLKECMENDMDPMSVVASLASEYGLCLTEEDPPGEDLDGHSKADRERMWVFLRNVARCVDVATLSEIADAFGDDIISALDVALDRMGFEKRSCMKRPAIFRRIHIW